MENRQEFLKQSTFTKNDILQNVFAPNNFNGVKAQRDLDALVYEENRRYLAG